MSGPEIERAVRIRSIELREVALPLVRPFRTSFGEERTKDAILVHVDAGVSEGWGECVASTAPRYSEEWNDGVWSVIRDHLGPPLIGREIVHPRDVGDRLRFARGHRMAKAALEAAIVDAWLRARGASLTSFVGGVRDRIPCGVSVGIAAEADAMLDEIRGYLAMGYRRIKLKIEPGRDVDVVGRIRGALGPDVPLSVDANAAYSLRDVEVFRELDAFDLVMIEQPLDHDDLWDHAELARRVRSPICLDESIRSAHDAAVALDIGACRIINVKQGRIGGIVESTRIHDAALERGAPVWIGGMLETGIGRAVNVALASMPGVTMPGDTSASDRYFDSDLTQPFEVDRSGTMAVPTGPGIGVEPLRERLDETTVRTQLVGSN